MAGMKARGVGEIVEVGASIQSTKDAVNLAESHDNIYAAVGVHPEDIERLTPEDMQWLADLTHRDKVVAIGEIGLDYYYDEPGEICRKSGLHASFRWLQKHRCRSSFTAGMPQRIH